MSKNTTPFRMWLVTTLFLFLSAPWASTLQAQSPSIPESEKQALVDLFNQCDGANWRPSSQQWDLNADPTTWRGVKIENGHVTELNLTGIRIKGEIPSSFGKLTELQKFFCSSNQITKFPDELFTLPKLREFYGDTQNIGETFTLTMSFPKKVDLPSLEILYLPDNQISGTLPADINLPKIKLFVIHNNKLTGSIPTALAKSSTLEYLYLIGNDFTGEIPQDWSGCTSLKQILVDKNKRLEGTFPASLTTLPELVSISFQRTSIGGEIPASIGDLKKLQDLLLTDTKLAGAIPETIGDCSALAQLALGDCKFNGPLPQTLTKLKKLKLFQITGNTIGGDIPTWLGDITSLEDLRMAKCGFTGEIPVELFPIDKTSEKGLKKLKNLDLSYNSLSGYLPKEITNCSSLVRLWLSHNHLLGNPCGYFTHANFPKLVQIEIADNQFEGSIGTLLTNPERVLTKVNIANNNFSGSLLPTSSTSAYGPLMGFAQEAVLVEGNRFQFADFSVFKGDLQPNGLAFYTIVYAPQKPTTDNRTLTLKMGQTTKLDATLANPADWRSETVKDLPNSYQWYKDGQKIAEATEAIFEIASFSATDAGTYHCEITNIIAPKLTLRTGDFVLAHDTNVDEIAQHTFAIERIGNSIFVEGATAIALYQLDGSCVAKANGSKLAIEGIANGVYILSARLDNTQKAVKYIL